MVVANRRDVSGPLRITIGEAENDYSKVRGLMLTQGEAAALDWLTAEKSKAKEFVSAGKAKNAAAKKVKSAKEPKDDNAYEGYIKNKKHSFLFQN